VGVINAIDPAAIAALVDPDGMFDLVADGFRFTEGPVWHEDGSLFFTDVPNDTIVRWHRTTGARAWRQPAEIPNGMTRDPEGRLLCCEQSTSMVTRYDADGTRTVVASHFGGKELNSPNDVVCRSDGAIFFTDPPAGREPPHGRKRDTPRELDFQGVFMLAPDAQEPVLLLDDMVLPNGLCFSPDESVLYINDTLRIQIVAIDVAVDGTASNRRVYFQQPGPPPDPAVLAREMHELGRVTRGLPDGMCADAQGNIYCGGDGGILITDPSSRPLGTIATPAFVGNLCWGDPDWRSLYVCACDQVLRLRLRVEGAPPAHPR
jgi:gluconolactonase